MKNPIFFFTMLCCFSMTVLHSQVNDFAKHPDPSLFRECNTNGWVKFADGLSFDQNLFFEKYAGSFALAPGFQMKPVRTHQDAYGFTHVRYQQYFQNQKIKGGEYIIHTKEGRALTENGQIFTPVVVRNASSISESTALKAALNYIHAEKYFWEDPVREEKLKNNRKAKQTSYYPKGELVYLWKPDLNQLVLTYAFPIYVVDPGKSGKYYINAADASVEYIQPIEYTCDHTTFLSNWYNVKDIWTNDVAVVGTSYDLEDDCQDAVYGVYDTNGFIFNTPDNIWNTDWLRSGAQSLFTIKISYLWFSIMFNRAGHDNNDGNLDITQAYFFTNSGGNNNASYTYDEFGDDEIRVGIGDNPGILDDYNCVDVLGHEFTHGITQYEASLVYQMEAGALNESFSDIFGEWLEFKELGFNNWLIGNDRIVNGCPNPLRYMANPGAQNFGTPPCTTNFNDPNTYLGTNWVSQVGCVPMGGTTGNDYCGVHTNSGVQNQMFNLLAAGGNGWNNGLTCHAAVNNGFFWSVGGIGIDNAARIGYKVLCDYLTSTSGYADARNAWVHAAEDIFGVCSYEAIQTGKAWWAVGINPPPASNYNLCNQNFGGSPSLITSPGIVYTQPGCFVNVQNTGNFVEFKSGVKVHLNDGFHATYGSNFKADISDCSYAAY